MATKLKRPETAQQVVTYAVYSVYISVYILYRAPTPATPDRSL